MEDSGMTTIKELFEMGDVVDEKAFGGIVIGADGQIWSQLPANAAQRKRLLRSIGWLAGIDSESS